MDTLNRVFHALRLKPQVFYRLALAAPWGLLLSSSKEASFHLVETGECWLRITESNQFIKLGIGDLIVLSNTRRYELVDHVDTTAVPLSNLLENRSEGGIVSLESGASNATTTLICGVFRAEQDADHPLFSLLPPLIHIQSQQGQIDDWLATPLQLIASEARQMYPGYETVISRLMDILFIMVARYWIAHHSPSEGDWLSALYHPQIGPVLDAIHREPERPWELETMAHIAHMSRSTFAMRFTQLVGEPPMKYLTRWRIQLATMWLTESADLTITQIAHRIGYTSAYAFSKVFKRVVGISPTDYRKSYLPKMPVDSHAKSVLS